MRRRDHATTGSQDYSTRQLKGYVVSAALVLLGVEIALTINTFPRKSNFLDRGLKNH